MPGRSSRAEVSVWPAHSAMMSDHRRMGVPRLGSVEAPAVAANPADAALPAVYYYAPADIQLARVDRQCIVAFCSALQSRGAEVTLVAMKIRTRADEPAAEHPLDLYRIPMRFATRLRRVPVDQRHEGGPLPTLARLAVHTTEAVRAAGTPTARGRLIFYTKTYSSALVLTALARVARTPTRVVFEAHVPPASRMQRKVLGLVDGVVANTYVLREELVERHGLPSSRVIGTHQGTDLESWERLEVSKEAARSRLGLPENQQLVVYTGKVVIGYREVEHILAAAALLRDAAPTVHFLIVGGRADHVEHYRQRVIADNLTNVAFVGFVRPVDVHLYQLAADLLLLYYPSGLPLNDYRSPGKLFEYMASRRPIVAVDLPVLREVLGEPPAAFLVPPDAPDLLAREILDVLSSPGPAARIAATARERVREFTWDARARTILGFVDSLW